MIIHKTADILFSSQCAIKVLRVLRNNIIGLTGRQIANNAGVTPQTAHNALANLESLKIINRVIAGASHLFTLNRNNYLVKNMIEPVFNSEVKFRESVFSAIKKNLNKYSVSAIVFGSVARNEETALSDFDLCIVYDKEKNMLEKKVDLLSNSLYREFGITLAPFYITAKEFKKRGKGKKPPISEIIKEGIVLSGKTISELL